jgi:glyceraldehyde 3-phosphate dehydrogenase
VQRFPKAHLKADQQESPPVPKISAYARSRNNNKENVMARIAIHGFGRIGRSLMKAALKNNLFFPVSISDIKDVRILAALFEVDSNYGRWPEEITTKDSCFVIGGRTIPFFDSSKALPDWKALGVDLVIDCTGAGPLRVAALRPILRQAPGAYW